jgi:hypothetical protein
METASAIVAFVEGYGMVGLAVAALSLLGNADGGPLPDRYRDFTALRIQIEGEIERRDDLLVFEVDFDSAEIL